MRRIVKCAPALLAFLMLLSALFATTAPASPSALQSRALPNFEVTALDGHMVKSDQLSTNTKWLLIYIEPGCRQCDDIFRVFKKEGVAPSAMEQKIIVVVGGRSANEVKALAGRFMWLPQSAWYADPLRTVAPALKLKGSPVIFGVQMGNIEWNVDGSLAQPKTLESILMTWCEG